MPVNTIVYQPVSAQLLAAYRPIILKVAATATGGDPVPPYVVCDIYVEDVYYTSIFRTTPETDGNWWFDISEPLKKYLQPDIAQVDNAAILLASHSSAKVKCRFRASDIDLNGFTVEEATAPVQATRTTEAVSGTGLASNDFFVINAALQHEDNQNLAIHLNSFKTGDWDSDAFPLSHRSKYFFCPGDSDHFPVIYKGDCIQADLILHYKLRGETEFTEETAVDLNTCDPIDFAVTIDGNQVQVALDDSLESGHKVLVQYRKQPSTTWLDAGVFTTDSFAFNINGSDIVGDYDIRVIHYCSDCFNAEPVEGEFTLVEGETNLGWRGINPVCFLTAPPATIYITLELRNPATTVLNLPDNISPTYKRTESTADLYAKFFSDAAHLTPLAVTGTVNIYIKKRIETDRDTHFNDYVTENMVPYSVAPVAVTEMLLEANVRTDYLEQYYITYPSLDHQNDSEYTYTAFPTHRVPSANNGQVFYEDLQEYNTDTLVATGTVKPNLEADPDYIAPATNTDACPIGPARTVLLYDVKLEVAKVEIAHSGIFIYGEPATTEDVGNQYVLNVPRYTNINISIKVKTLDGANVTGYCKATVIYYDGTAFQTAVFNLPNNIETALPQIFQNVSLISISNY